MIVDGQLLRKHLVCLNVQRLSKKQDFPQAVNLKTKFQKVLVQIFILYIRVDDVCVQLRVRIGNIAVVLVGNPLHVLATLYLQSHFHFSLQSR